MRTPAEMWALGQPLTSYRTFLVVGDSKSIATNAWLYKLSGVVEGAQTYRFFPRPTPMAVTGQTVAYWAANIGASIAASDGTPDYVLINLGANDVVSLPAEATWKANYLTVADAIAAKWPGVPVYLVKVWKRGEAADCDTLAGWIDDLVAQRSFLHVGHDERGWLEGGDDGATMTTDGIHYSAAGQTECAAQWKTVLGL